ncbi:hypothetical protein LINPERHAP1_LOCUS25883 [Linum perenne]
MSRDWEVTLEHIYRKSNILTDSLTAKGQLAPFGTHLIEACGSIVARWCVYDRLRSSQP